MAGMNFFDFHEKVTRKARADGAATGEAPKPAAERDILTVTQLTAQIERVLKAGLPGSVLVKGEVSNFKLHGGSGHIYFTLKDPDACIDCVMFRADAARLKFTPGDGMELLVTGRVAVYPQRGRYQLYVTRIEPLGQGALELAFRQLCAKLEAEGLFAAERKRAIPAYPMRVALVTSTQTAALQDMLKVLRRFPWVKLMVCHVPVQGDGSAEKIAAALHDLNRCAASVGGVDAILLGRGGGSLEDLWEFNEEVVARAIVASRIPVITGIGHEVDVSVADLVADYHAHTPTEAAQVATAQWRTAGEVVDACGMRLRREMRTHLGEWRQRLEAVGRHEVFRRPLDRVNAARQLLDDRQRAMMLGMGERLRRLQARLHADATRLEQYRPAALVAKMRQLLAEQRQALVAATGRRLRLAEGQLATAAAALRERHPRHAVQLGQERLAALSARLVRSVGAVRQRWGMRVDALAAHLNAVGPEQVLRRGYSITLLKKTGAVVKSAAQVKAGERLRTRLADGEVESVAEDGKQLRLFE